MAADSDLVAAVEARIVRTEMAQRTPMWDDRPVTPPPGLPPLTVLVAQAYPTSVLERRLRFLRLMGWYPDEPPTVTPDVEPPLPPEVTIEDRVAAIYGAARIESRDPALQALFSALRPSGIERGAGPDERAAVTAFFDQQAGAVDPAWRDRWPRHTGADSAWARAEAAALPGDRLFGRLRPGDGWRGLSRVVWRLAEFKRRRWE